jgi:RasGEF domain
MLRDVDTSASARDGNLLAYTPKQIAAALTVLEGRMYNLVRPADYIIHLSQSRGSRPVVDACVMTEKVAFWVKSNVVYHSVIDDRVALFEFFVDTALVSPSNSSDLIIMLPSESRNVAKCAISRPLTPSLARWNQNLSKTSLKRVGSLGPESSSD